MAYQRKRRGQLTSTIPTVALTTLQLPAFLCSSVTHTHTPKAIAHTHIEDHTHTDARTHAHARARTHARTHTHAHIKHSQTQPKHAQTTAHTHKTQQRKTSALSAHSQTRTQRTPTAVPDDDARGGSRANERTEKKNLHFPLGGWRGLRHAFDCSLDGLLIGHWFNAFVAVLARFRPLGVGCRVGRTICAKFIVVVTD